MNWNYDLIAWSHESENDSMNRKYAYTIWYRFILIYKVMKQITNIYISVHVHIDRDLPS